MTKGPIYCECGNEKPHDSKPGCLRCRELEGIYKQKSTRNVEEHYTENNNFIRNGPNTLLLASVQEFKKPKPDWVLGWILDPEERGDLSPSFAFSIDQLSDYEDGN